MQQGGGWEDNVRGSDPQLRWEDQQYRPNVLLHAVLFVLTFLSIAWACSNFALTPAASARIVGATGAFDAHVQLILIGLPYAALLTFFLLAHEFGHYFAARAHGVVATLPYFLPMPWFPFGTLGAVIRTRSPILTRAALFDIGVAGPLAGFVVALAYIVVGTLMLPGIEAIYHIHPEYRGLSELPDYGIGFGSFALLEFVRVTLTPPTGFFPPPNEIYHYPLLAIGWFAMVVTSLNLLPLGQLDGGHITYAMFGSRQRIVGRWFARFMLIVGLGSIGSLLLDATRTPNPDPLYQFLQGIFSPVMEWIARYAPWWFEGSSVWLVWSLLVRFVIRVEHPPVPDPTPIDRRRMAIGWISLAILVMTFSYSAIYYGGDPPQSKQTPSPGGARQSVEPPSYQVPP